MALAGIPAHVTTLLKNFHAQSDQQEAAIPISQWQSLRTQFATDLEGAKAATDALMVDKFIALEEDKCHFIYTALLGTGATTVVEIGTSFGVSTIYLALVVGENVKRHNKARGLVIGTEKESSKAAIARANWKTAGPEIANLIDLKEGDLTETLAGDIGIEGQSIDCVLLDSWFLPDSPCCRDPADSAPFLVWPYVALPALKLLLPKLRPGALVFTDNVVQAAEGYGDLLQVLQDPNGPFRTVTLPFKGGLGMSVYVP